MRLPQTRRPRARRPEQRELPALGGVAVPETALDPLGILNPGKGI